MPQVVKHFEWKVIRRESLDQWKISIYFALFKHNLGVIRMKVAQRHEDATGNISLSVMGSS